LEFEAFTPIPAFELPDALKLADGGTLGDETVAKVWASANRAR
jgi:hypothetical protein